MVGRLHCFLMTWKVVPDSVLESCNIVQEFMEKFLLKQFRKNQGLFKKITLIHKTLLLL
jgi:hypothetical protein